VDASHFEHFALKIKIWIEDEKGSVVFGAGRPRILQAVDRLGSLQAAAKELSMSYRAVWGKIKATEDSLGQPLVARRAGGTRGGGSELTPLGKALVERFQRLQTLTETAADDLFQGVFTERDRD